MKAKTKITVLLIASILLMSIFIKEVDASNLMNFDFSKITKTQTNVEKAPTDSAGVVDENLKAALNQELNKRDGTTRPDTQDITIQEMESFNILRLSYKGIKEITGLEYAINLYALDLFNNQISDISSLKNLNKLISLDLGYNKVNDISSLKNLIFLRELFLENNQINDISSLNRLHFLLNLNLNNNQINDISSLGNLNNLNEVYLSNNRISDISSLGNLNNLKKVDLSNNRISDLRPLQGVSKNKLNLKNQMIEEDFAGLNQNVAPTFSVYDIDGTEIAVDLERTAPDLMNFTGHWIRRPIGDCFSGNVIFENYNYIDNSDLISPTLSADANQIVNLHDIQSDENLKILFNVKANDNIDGDITNKVTVDQSNVKYDKVGTYDIVFSVSDKSSNIATKTSKLNVIDSDVPVINSLDRLDIKAKKPLSDDELKSLFKVSASDNYDGDITSDVVVNQSKVNYNVPGVYDVVFSVVDSAGNRADKKVFLKILSNEVPVLKGVEDIEIVNGSYFDPMEGVSANDYEDGDITDAIDVYSKDLKDGLSTIYNYSVSDSDGNVVEVNRTVKYVSVPNNKPVIDGVDNTNIFVGEDFDPMDGVSASDIEDGDLSSSISLSGSINNKVSGDYTLTYSVVDSDNNIVSVDRIISVKDIVVYTNNKPIITGANDVKVKLGSDFDIMAGIIASDVEDGDLSNNIIVVRNELDTSIVGDYKIVYSVIDSDSNISNVSRTISVYDEGNKINNKVDVSNKNNIDKENKTTIVKKLIETGKSSIYFIFVSVLLFLAYFIQIKKQNILK